MAIKEYSIETRYGVKIVELTRGEFTALTTKGEVSKDSKALLGKAALILENLDSRSPLAPSKLATLCGVARAQDATWNRALTALTQAGLVERWNHGPKTAYTRVYVEDQIPEVPTASAESWDFVPHHTLAVGGDKSHRASIFQGLLEKLAPSVEAGLAEVHTVGSRGGSLVALRAEMAVLAEARAEIARRIATAAERGGNLGRISRASTTDPMLVLLVPNLPQFHEDLSDLGDKGKQALWDLEVILATGRPANVFVVAGSSSILNSSLRSWVDDFGNRVASGLNSRYENDVLLGEDAAFNGYDSTLPESDSRSVIGFVSDGRPAPTKIRFPRISDKEASE